MSEIYAEGYRVQVIRSRRSTAVIRITSAGEIQARVPLSVTDRKVRMMIAEKRDWIDSKLAQIKKRREEAKAPSEKLTHEEIRRLGALAVKVLPVKASLYAPLVGVTYNRITVRCQHTRWGSCSSKGNLNFNCLLMLTPEHVQDYVVVHELCHRREMNHSAAFWNEVENVLPDYKESVKWLRDHGSDLIGRIPD